MAGHCRLVKGREWLRRHRVDEADTVVGLIDHQEFGDVLRGFCSRRWLPRNGGENKQLEERNRHSHLERNGSTAWVRLTNAERTAHVILRRVNTNGRSSK